MKSKKRSNSRGKSSKESVATPKTGEPVLEHGLEDAGNGERFVGQHGENVRCVRKWDKRLVWHGRNWNEEDDGSIEQMAKATARSIYREADSRPSSAKAINAHARNTLSVAGRARMVVSAASETEVLAKPGDFNQRPILF